MYSVLSLFSGIGGLCHMGIQAANLEGKYKVTTAVEKDHDRRQILSKYCTAPIYADITTFVPDRLYSVVVGGVPCKGFSAAGNRQGLYNVHSALWFEMLRVACMAQPDFILLENVRGILDRGLRSILGGLRMAGYCYDDPQIISAAELGASHLRQRLFVIAYPNGAKFSHQPQPWARQVGKSIAQVRSSAIWQDLTPTLARNHDGLPDWAYCDRGSVPNRQKRMQALGDACTPYQAAVCWKRIDYLMNLKC